MATSPPASPMPQRPISGMVRPAPRSNSRMSMSSKVGGSRASDEDSRTAVRVVVRVRPALKPTDPGYDLIPHRFQRSMVHVNSDTNIAIDSPQGRKLFVFDRVFGEEVMQDGIWEYLEDSVNSFMQGYNVSLLAYGQSGAGKSYTMGTAGPLDQHHPETMGVIPRAAYALFEKLDPPTVSVSPRKANRSSLSHLRGPSPRYSMQSSNAASDRSWSLKATYLEIYNESLRDLLLPDSMPSADRNSVTIREDKGNILLTGLRQVDVNSVEDLMAVLSFGSSIRQTDATAINAKSSRSHAVFSLNLVQRKPTATQQTPATEKRFSTPIDALAASETWITTDSKLHFVDLAGSERLKNTGAQGERAKEGIAINAGLAALGKVISQLSSRNAGSHVSYRDSKLTRLLQDSLGGNAITYMIACVTPAEFHLGETLNTVQYAQRARAIQSKPRIQATEEGDKQAIIDRLKAEVSFLREQIRSAEHGGAPDRRTLSTSDRTDRQSEREIELQNQLLDTQENYNNLSQRHAKLIAEMANARDIHEAGEGSMLEHALGDSATERLNRSNSFAQAVEQVVLEYEKTIQSLEHSLSNTRSTLSSTETSLLERETKCAYIETINTQLQTRLQKLMDRESSTETYLHDLESRLDSHTSGEEKNTAIIIELRKELSRARENEASCEDYISTLEERLAEADQDAELMQREMENLAQIIERQRSLGKLDSLLHELDHIQEDKIDDGEVAGGGVVSKVEKLEQARSQPAARPANDAIPEEEEMEEEEMEASVADARSISGDDRSASDSSTSNARAKFVVDQLEHVTQELVHMKAEHDATIHDYESLNSKYEEALRTIAELQDAVDEARYPTKVRDSVISLPPVNANRPESLSSEPRSTGQKDGEHLSSRSLSSELSSVMESPLTVDTLESEAESVTVKADDNELAYELEQLRMLTAAREAAEQELATRYSELEKKYHETLDVVEDLQTEISKSRAIEASSPRAGQPVIRRKSSQNVMIIDRAHRSFASLRNIAADNFEDQPDVMQNFELNLNVAMHELHARSERIQELEADVSSAKREMESKMAIIAGLTRERSSLQTSPMDISMVSSLRTQLELNETQLRHMREAYQDQEQELTAEIESLRNKLKETADARPPLHDDEDIAAKEQRIMYLENELLSWESRHQAALDNMVSPEAQLKIKTEELEGQIESLNVMLAETQQAKGANSGPDDEAKHENLVKFLRNEIDEYKAIINSNAARIAELEQKHTLAQSAMESANKDRDAALSTGESHKELVYKLETQLEAVEDARRAHDAEIEALKALHRRDLEQMKSTEQHGYHQQMEVLMTEHSDAILSLENAVNEARDELMRVATQVAYAVGLDVSVEKITERIDSLVADQGALAEERRIRQRLEHEVNELSRSNNDIVRDLEQVKATLNEVLSGESPESVDPLQPVQNHLVLLRNRMSHLKDENNRNSRIVQELEEQLASNFDEVQATKNRLSMLAERNAQLEEVGAVKAKMQVELDAIKEEYASLQVRVNDLVPQADVNRSDSISGQNSSGPLRKSSSVTSLPSPPPLVPLPPLPANASASPTTHGSPPTPTHGHRLASKDQMALAQIQDDQEARIQSIEKSLKAEKTLNQVLEESLNDLERKSNKLAQDCEGWRHRAQELEAEIKVLRERAVQPQHAHESHRLSQMAVEEERRKRELAEAAQRKAEERMQALSKKKKKASLNCF